MSLENPTRLRIGMHGNFSGTDYRLVGRVVMGVNDGGETYYWNEFNLESRSGGHATLVYEETERGAEWRLFTLFEPKNPITAADAATKKIGDRLNLTGQDVRVTLRDTSCVYRIEGQGPDGLKVGDVADYFNAETVGIMQVVSWTGDEVEFYNGVNLSAGVVNSAFNLPFVSTSSRGAGGVFSGFNRSIDSSYSGPANHYLSPLNAAVISAMVLIFFALTFGQNVSCSRHYESAPVKKTYAGKPPLSVGAKGMLKAKIYRITGHAVVEIATAGSISERHEYQLTDDDGQISLLVCGLKSDDKNWTLFTALAPMLPPRAAECAAKKIGDTVNVDGVVGPVREIFQSTVRQADGTTTGELLDGCVCFGFLAQSEYNELLVRWNRDAIYFQRGERISASDALAALSDQAWK